MTKNNYFNKEIEEALATMSKDPVYIEKYDMDEYELSVDSNSLSSNRKKPERRVAWIRNHNYKHRQWRRFLSLSPGISISERGRHYNISGIFICLSYYDEDDKRFYEHTKYYAINLFNHLFISKRGDLRVHRGKIQIWRHNMAYVTGGPSWVKEIRHNTNRRIRNMPVNENNCNHWNYYRKQNIVRFD